MLLHKLIARHLKARDDTGFYALQAQDAIRWIEQSGVALGEKTSALDLGCGHGVFGAELMKKGCKVTFADEENLLLPELSQAPFRRIKSSDRSSESGISLKRSSIREQPRSPRESAA